MSSPLKNDSDARKSFRKELFKVMPGLKWTIHKTRGSRYIQMEPGHYIGAIEATATISSGMNRLFTLSVSRHQKYDGTVFYKAESSGYGTRAPWLYSWEDKTVARALRGLQSHYERMESEYGNQARYLREARQQTNEPTH